VALGVIDIVLKQSSVLSNREQSMLGIALLVEALAERDRRNFNLVRQNLAAELPLDRLGAITVQVVLLEQTDSPVSVTNGEIFSIMRDNELGNRVALPIRSLQRSIELYKMASLRIHDLDFSVVLSDQDLSAIWSEFDRSKYFQLAF